MQRKKIIASMLLAAMVLLLAGNAFASDWETEWRELREYLGEKQSPIEKPTEVESFRKTYWDHLFPVVTKALSGRNPERIDFNPDGVLEYDVMYYGFGDIVESNSKDGKGAWLYLGYTRDNRYVSNITFAAQSWKNPQMLDRDYYITGEGMGKFKGLIHPFKTEYNDPEFIGRTYLGEGALPGEQIPYGRQVLNTWAKNVMNRNIGWQDGKNFYSIFNNDLDRFLKHVTITVPPTSRSYGQCLVWFKEASGRMTHRTFYIVPTEPIDFIAKRYTWDEPTKTLTVFYEKKGLEKAEGILSSALYTDLESPLNNFFSKGLINFDVPGIVTGFVQRVVGDVTYDLPIYNISEKPGGNKELAVLEPGGVEPKDDSKWSLMMHGTYDAVKESTGMIGKEREVKFRLPYLKDQRAEDITLTAIVNANHAFPEYHDNAYANNEIDVVIPATIKQEDPDFIVDKIEAGATSTKPGSKHSGKIHIRRAADAVEPMNTTIALTIANGTITSSKDIPVSQLKAGESRVVPFDWQAGGDKSKGVTIAAEINPQKLGPARLQEKTYANNSASVGVPMAEGTVDLSIKTAAWAQALYIGETYTFSVRVFNTSDKPISTDIVWKFAGKQVRKGSITVPAKGNVIDRVNLTMPKIKEDAKAKLEIEVNPSRNKPSNEVTYTNNKLVDEILCLGPDGGESMGASDPYLVK